MNKKFNIELYGKQNCQKCDALKNKLNKILNKDPELSDLFTINYHDTSTIDGLIAFAKAETVNGQRIPSLQITKYNKKTKLYDKIEDRRKEEFIDEKLFVPVYLQLETDYSNIKKSVIKPAEIINLISLAKNS